MWLICIIISLCIPVFCFIFSLLLSVYFNKKKGLHIGKQVAPIKESFFTRVFFSFPYTLIDDLYHKEDYSFNDSGFHLIVGEQGSGKTITAVYLLKKYKHDYPLLNIRTNMGYKYEDGTIKSWRDLVFVNNGIYGQIDLIDEVQNWFNSLQSKDFPVEMFAEITQQRKQRKMILGTSQVWNRVAKPIREQVKLVYKPRTFFGCLTVVPVFKPIVNDEGQADKMLFRKIFFFVHNPDIRDSFDTYHKIEVMSLKGFKSEDLQIRKENKILPIDINK